MSFRNLYVHIPFCRSKCGYCAFYSEPGREELIDAYLTKLGEEIERAELDDRLDTVYVGGGTPTLLSTAQLERLTSLLPAAEERSIEANPETIDKAKAMFLSGEFSRISLGVQSFDAKKRHLLGRCCSDKAIHEALELISLAPFRHRNIDLIYGAGEESVREWERELETALGYPIDHLSCYALTHEENTALDPAAQLVGHEEREADMAELTRAMTANCLPRYEISNYAKPGRECRHNMNVWNGLPYLGVGAASSSFDGLKRWSGVESITSYLEGAPRMVDELAPRERAFEVFAINLRTVKGWSRSEWERTLVAQTLSWQELQKQAEQLKTAFPDCINHSETTISLTERGLDFWDTIALELMMPE